MNCEETFLASPLPFPDRDDVIREEAARFQRLSGEEKCRIIQEMIEHGFRLIANSPHREQIEAMLEADEAAFRRAQAKVLADYEAKHDKRR